jgi:hypothetical protein
MPFWHDFSGRERVELRSPVSAIGLPEAEASGYDLDSVRC